MRFSVVVKSGGWVNAMETWKWQAAKGYLSVQYGDQNPDKDVQSQMQKLSCVCYMIC